MENPPIIDGPKQSPSREKGGWLGPLFMWEIVREARKGRGYLPRIVYASGLLLLLYVLMQGKDITLKEAARFGEHAFNSYLVFQYLAVFLLTPVYVASTFIEDRQQGTLPLLLTTFLSPRELVFGKMMGRLAPMLGVLLAGVPILAILQLFGGISFGKLIVHSIITLLLLLIVGMQAIRCSTLYGSVGNAVFYTYFRLLGSFILSYFLSGLTYVLAVVLFRSNEYYTVVVTIVFMACNLWLGWTSVLAAMASMQSRKRGIDRTLPEETRAEHSSGYQVRLQPANTNVAVEVQELVQNIQEQVRTTIKVSAFKPRVYQNWPIVWRQIYFPDRTSLTAYSFIFAIMVVLIYVIFAFENRVDNVRADHIFPSYHWTVRMLMSIVLFLTMLHTAGSLAMERVQHTLINLLIAPMSVAHVLFQFAWGSLWRYRWLLALLAGMVFVSMLINQPASLLWYPLIFFSQLVCYTMLSLVISMSSKTAFQARLLASFFLFMALIVLPNLLTNCPWHVKVLLMPYASWEMIAVIKTNNWQLTLGLFISCVMLWSISAFLFFLNCMQVRRWLNRL